MSDIEIIDKKVEEQLLKLSENKTKINMIEMLRIVSDGLTDDINPIYEHRKKHIFLMSIKRNIESNKIIRDFMSSYKEGIDFINSSLEFNINKTKSLDLEKTILNDLQYSERASAELIEQELVEFLSKINEEDKFNMFTKNNIIKKQKQSLDFDQLMMDVDQGIFEDQHGLNDPFYNHDLYDWDDDDIY